MKPRHTETDQSPMGKKPTISLAEVALVAAYSIAVVLIPESWLDTPVGSMAFAIASKINPYLSGYSIAFAKDQQHFIHCHVLATWIIAPTLFWPVIIRAGGLRQYEVLYMESLKQQPLIMKWGFYLLCLAMLFGMLWLVDYPLSRTERGVWVNSFGVAFYAFATACVISVLGYGLYFLLKATLTQIIKGETK